VLAQQVGRGQGVDLQVERRAHIGLERQLERAQDRVARLVVGTLAHRNRAGRLGQQVEQPFGHFLVQRRQDREHVLLAVLFQQRLQGVDGRIGIAMIVPAGIDEMDQIAGQGIGAIPARHGHSSEQIGGGSPLPASLMPVCCQSSNREARADRKYEVKSRK
jgi:hypothetical protein